MDKSNAIRSQRAAQKPRIYLAGKISKHDWRGAILGPHRPGALDGGSGASLFDPQYVEQRREFFYGGPFFISCDHGCAHGPATHGAAFAGCLSDDAPLTPEETRSAIFNVSLARISRADLVFAYLNEADAFGTLVELGAAFSMGKPVFLLFGPDVTQKQREDMWFARMGGVVLDGTIRSAFKKALETWGRCRAIASAA
jgi:hypothetical protein